MDSEEDYANAFRDIFTEAVKCRLRTAVPIGFELSGGLDSSSIVCMAEKISDNLNNRQLDMINTFSLIYSGFNEGDERYFIKKVTDSKKVDHHFTFAENISPLKQIKTILWHQEQPFFTPFISNLWASYKKMQDNDINILLLGIGGDEVLSDGSSYLLELAMNFKWIKLIKEIFSISKRNKSNIFKIFFEKIIIRLVPESLKKLLRPYYTKGNEMPFTQILNNRFLNSLGGNENIKYLYWKFYSPLLNSKTAKLSHYYDIESIKYGKYTEMIDKATSAFSIEPRYPFLDKRLIEFCFSLPTEIKFNSGWTKFILRLAMEDILPKEIQCRTNKGGTEQVYYTNLLLYEKTFLDDMIYDNNGSITDYIDFNQVKNIYENYKMGIKGSYLFPLWLVSIFYIWLQENENIKRKKFK